MNAAAVFPGPMALGVRWAARVLALLMGGMVLLFLIGEGFHPSRLKASEWALMVPFWVTWVGLWLGWRWEGLGGSVVVTGTAAFYLINYAQARSFPRGLAFLMIAAPGVLFLLSWFLHRRSGSAPAAP